MGKLETARNQDTAINVEQGIAYDFVDKSEAAKNQDTAIKVEQDAGGAIEKSGTDVQEVAIAAMKAMSVGKATEA